MGDAEELKKLNNRKTRLKASLTRHLNFVKNELQNENNLSKLKLKSTQLEDLYGNYATLLDEFDQFEINLDAFIEQFEIDYLETKSLLDDKINSISTNHSSAVVGTSMQPTSICAKLPKLTLPEFSGNILKWKEFWDSYEAKIHKTNLPDCDKFEYLVQCLKGRAQKSIEGMPVTSQNYPKAIAILEKKYYNRKLIIDSHYSILRNIPPIEDKDKNNVYKLRKTLDDFEVNLRCLEAFEEDVEHNSIQSLIYSKFPENIINKVFENVDQDSLTTSELRLNLDKIISSFERTETVKEKHAEKDHF
ncbi:uncharacterized protein LOC135845119 [Planococcus citri]|uniref:uncharacterized protein LOC135845119 n=1 Tax=Planococcus citri TaxID=170843 RepID=UPI0031F8C349